ncbi:MAG TPA: signal peptidase I [Actinomycetota bacterium]|jgi:signal peptidase I
MRQRRGGRTIVTIAVAGVSIALLAAAWLVLAPPQLGGRTTYVTTVGESMEPGISSGDLVLVRPASSYEVGDVAAYRSQELGAVVLHRIVGVGEDGFEMQGDANSWLDPEHPTEADMLGTQFIRVPWLGGWLAHLRTPGGLALLAGLVGAGVGASALRRRRRPSTTEDGSRRAATGEPRRPRPRVPARPAVRVLGVVAVALVALAVFTVVRPTTVVAGRAVTYDQLGDFTYTAEAPEGGPVYDADGIDTGDPVYLRLSQIVDMSFAYRFETAATATVNGTIGLSVVVSDQDGWSRSFALAEPTAFEGAVAGAAGTLDLGELSELVAEVQRLTRVEREGYEVRVIADVQAEADVEGERVQLSFTPALPFVLDERELQLAPEDETLDNLLHPASGGMVELQDVQDNDIVIAGVRIGPQPARIAAAGAAIAAIVALVLVTGLVGRSRRRAEHEQIEATYGRMLVSIEGGASTLLTHAVDVDSMETLALLAAHYDQVILHEERGGQHTYFFRDGGIAYRYDASHGSERPRTDAPIGP